MRFLCDAMLSGLSRWLRACGYASAFAGGIDDGELVARARTSGDVLLSSDAPLFCRRAIARGEVTALFVPRHARPTTQAAHVLAAFELEVRTPRCMACGGALAQVPRESAESRVPPRVRTLDTPFFECTECARMYWHGTHWARIEQERAAIACHVAAARDPR
jgi:uncharacterized protein with PIN domain